MKSQRSVLLFIVVALAPFGLGGCTIYLGAPPTSPSVLPTVTAHAGRGHTNSRSVVPTEGESRSVQIIFRQIAPGSNQVSAPYSSGRFKVALASS
jgi:hypothetical protein